MVIEYTLSKLFGTCFKIKIIFANTFAKILIVLSIDCFIKVFIVIEVKIKKSKINLNSYVTYL